jgi:hypothetical protein
VHSCRRPSRRTRNHLARRQLSEPARSLKHLGHALLVAGDVMSEHMPSVRDEGSPVGTFIVMSADPALIRMLRAGRDEGRDLEEALDAFARVFGRPRAAERIGSEVTCHEANVIAYVLAASRHVDAAIVWLEEHAASDAEDDTHGGADFDAASYITGRR